VLSEAFCRPYQVAPGRFAVLTVSDSGSGMDEATRQRVFDPFFTTREKGRGTGLGLASAYGIIKHHGGMITVSSQVGQGSTFDLYLPLADRPAAPETAPDRGVARGSETVLLIDDEQMILDVGSAMLERLGYRAVSARSGEEGVQALQSMAGTIDLVILDMIMPGMDGRVTFERIRALAPGQPVLLSSGYAMDGQTEELMHKGCNGFIQKPFSLPELSRKIRSVLDAAAAPRINADSPAPQVG
jgi:CheY-like chemotaxis protein